VTYRGRVGLGMMTWKRPDLFRACLETSVTHLAGLVDRAIVIQDGGPCYVPDLPAGWRLVDHGHNVGWAESKNECLDWLAAEGCDHLFMIEDDTTVTSPQAITGYVDAAASASWHYLTAHPWGETTTRQVEVDGPVTYWAYVGSWWTYMSAYGYRTAGGYNLRMGGTMGDIELPQRWARLGLTSGWGRLPDATGSEGWVRPSCLTVPQSTIANQPGWVERQAEVLAWWAETMPETLPTEMRPAREKNQSRKCAPATP
jgi:hypothetical protein